MPRFFIPESPPIDDNGTASISLFGDDARHIARSLRMAVGDSVIVCDPAGQTYLCRLSYIRDEEVRAEVIETLPTNTETPYEIRLFMAYPKADKLEIVVQKAVELGVSRITPFESARCIKRPAPEKQVHLQQRLTRIAAEAAKQCGRARLPLIDTPLSYEAMLSEATTAELPLFCYEGEGTVSLRALLESMQAPRTVSVVVGAEGGFSDKEASLAKISGMHAVNLGPRILRCETAPAYILSALSYRFELMDAFEGQA